MINSREAKAEAIIGLLLFFSMTRRGVLVILFLQEVDLFTRHFDLKAKVRKKSCLGEQIFARREKFFDRALRLVNDFLNFKSSF